MASINWLFLDMDGFFAAVEQHLRPELRGHPVGVIPVETTNTCVIAANVAAKQHGVRTGTRVLDARRLCPGIALVKARPDTYVAIHHEVAKSIDRWLPIHKAYSVDEWAVRLLGPEREPARAEELGRAIKAQIYHDFSPWLGCSIGIAPTRLLAKIASDLDKPDGFTLLQIHDLPRRLAHLKLDDLCGISNGIDTRLKARGVRTVEQLWAMTRTDAVSAWGSVEGGRWWDAFHGRDEPELMTHRRTMGHANVLDPKFRSEDGSRRMLARLTTRLGIRMRDAGLVAHRLSIDVSCMSDQSGERRKFSADTDLPGINNTRQLLESFKVLWARRPSQLPTPMKVGVTVSGLVPFGEATGCLFGEHDRNNQLSETMDTITRRWGPQAAYFGAMHGASHDMEEKIAFGRVPVRLEGRGA
jgi:DNA polymerase-4